MDTSFKKTGPLAPPNLQNRPSPTREADSAPSAADVPATEIAATDQNQVNQPQLAQAEPEVSLYHTTGVTGPASSDQDPAGLAFPDPVDSFCETMCSEHSLEEVERMIQVLEAVAARKDGSLPPEMGFARAFLPANFAQMMPELLDALHVAHAEKALLQETADNPDLTLRMLDSIHTIGNHSKGLSGPELSDLIRDERATLPPVLQKLFDRLQLDRPENAERVRQLMAKTESLYQRLNNIDISQIRAEESYEAGWQGPPQANMSKFVGVTAPGAEARKAQLEMVTASEVQGINAGGFQGQDGLLKLLAIAEGMDPACRSLIQQMLRYGSEKQAQLGEIPDFKDFKPDSSILRKGHVAILLRMIQKGEGLAGFGDLLKKLGDPEARKHLSSTETNMLKELGMAVQDGEVINLANSNDLTNKLSSEDLSRLIQLKDIISTSFSAGPTASTDMATGMTIEWANAFLKDSSLALELEAEIKRGQERIDALQRQARESESRINAATQALQQAKTDAQTYAASFKRLEDALAPYLNAGKFALQPPISPQQVQALNAALAEFGLSISRRPDGSLSFYKAGAEISQGDFETKVSNCYEAKKSGLADHAAKVAEAEQKRAQLTAEGERIQANLAQEIAEQKERVTKFEQLKLVPPDELRAALSDPAVRKKLGPELVQKLEERLADYERMYRARPSLVQSARQQIEAAEADLAALSAAIADSRERAREAAALLADLFQKLSPHAANAARDLKQAADKLLTRLAQAPQPKPSEAAKMLQDWRQSLEKLFQTLQKEHHAQTGATQAARSQEQRFLERLKNDLKYHQQQLDQLDQRQHQRVLSGLRESLQQAGSLTGLARD